MFTKLKQAVLVLSILVLAVAGYSQGLMIQEQDFTGDGTLDLKIDNGIMWIQINRDDFSGSTKGLIDQGGITGSASLLATPIKVGGFADRSASWQTSDFNVDIVENSSDRGVFRLQCVDIANGKEITKEFTVTLDAGAEHAWIKYDFTNTGSSSFLYDQISSHIHDGAFLGNINTAELYDIDAYINSVGTINLTSLGWWRSYSPNATAPYGTMFRPSTGDAITFGFKTWSYPIHQVVAYYTGASTRKEPHIDFMAQEFTLGVGASVQFEAVVAFHGGSYTKGQEIYDNAQEPGVGSSGEIVWCDDFEGYAPGASVGSNWSLSGNISSVADPNEAYSGNQSLKMFGRIGSCWAAVADKLLEVTFPMTIELAVRNGTENTYGCHPYRASAALRTGPHWTNPGSSSIFTFIENGDLVIQGTYPYDTLSGYNLEQWYKFKVNIWIPGDGYVHTEYWVDGNYLGDYTREVSSLPNLMNAKYLDIAAQEGTVWFDDVCVSTMDEDVIVAFDIKPGSCPNPLNVKKGRMDGDSRDGSGGSMAAGDGGLNPSISDGDKGKKAVLPVAILGTEEFDVALIDATTVVLAGVSPVRSSYEDVATPVGDNAGECECNDYGPDGFDDMTIKFDKADIVAALGEVSDGDVVPLTISGMLLDGTSFEGVDCVLIRAGGNGHVADGEGPENDEPAIAGLSNFPNPFNPRTTISFSLPVASDATLIVYNLMGQTVATLADGFHEAGIHAVVWDGTAVASGVYFYRLEAGEFTQTKKMILMK